MNISKEHFIVLDAIRQIDTPELLQTKFSTGWVQWGPDDDYGKFIFELYRQNTYLKACVDFTSSECSLDPWTQEVFRSLILYGGCPVLVSRENRLQAPNFTILDHRYVRLNGDRTKFKYRPTSQKSIIYTSDSSQLEYIIYIALDFYNPYPTPFIYPSVKASQSLIGVHDQNISTLSNGFSPSALVSFNTGVPDQKTADEIERRINKKFCGVQNAGRVMVSFAKSKDQAPTVATIPQNQYSAQFDSLVKSSKEQIFANFKCTPSLIGITEGNNTGFNQNEYFAQLTLFHRFTCRPLQKCFIDALTSHKVELPVLPNYDNEYKTFVDNGVSNS